MARSEIRVIIDHSVLGVFATYTQPDTWRWTITRSVRWTHGKPWEAASWLRIEIDKAYGTVVDQVLTHFDPNRLVSFRIPSVRRANGLFAKIGNGRQPALDWLPFVSLLLTM